MTDLFTTLASIQETISTNEFDSLLWTGDINADFRRYTVFTEVVDNFIMDLNIYRSWDTFAIDFTHANEINDNTYTSIIDHFFWNEAINSLVEEAGVLHLPRNLSDHCPIYCKLSMDIDV